MGAARGDRAARSGSAACWLMALGVFFRRTLPFVAIALALGGFLVADRLGEDMIGHMAGPFFAVLLVTYSAGTVLEGRRLSPPRVWAAALLADLAQARPRQDSPVANAIFSTVFVVAAPMLFGQLHDQPRAAASRAAREGRATPRRERRDEAARGGARGAHADRGRAPRRRRARALRDDRAGRGRTPARDEGPGQGARRVRRRRDAPGARRSPSCAGCSASCARRTRSWRSRPQPSLAHLDALVRRWQAAGLPVVLEVDRRGARAARRRRPHRLPARPGGAGPRARRRPRRARERAVAYGARTSRVDVADDGAPHGPAAARHARARRRLRRGAGGGARRRRRLARRARGCRGRRRHETARLPRLLDRLLCVAFVAHVRRRPRRRARLARAGVAEHRAARRASSRCRCCAARIRSSPIGVLGGLAVRDGDVRDEPDGLDEGRSSGRSSMAFAVGAYARHDRLVAAPLISAR